MTNLRLSILIASFGFGNLEKWCITIPPTVSKSLSLRFELNFALNVSIGVKAETKNSSFAISLIKFKFFDS